MPDCDVGEAAGKDLGLKVLMSGRRPDRTGLTYFDTADPAGVILEIRASRADTEIPNAPALALGCRARSGS